MTIRLEPDRFGVRTKIDVHDRLLSITLHFRYRPRRAGQVFRSKDRNAAERVRCFAEQSTPKQPSSAPQMEFSRGRGAGPEPPKNVPT